MKLEFWIAAYFITGLWALIQFVIMDKESSPVDYQYQAKTIINFVFWMMAQMINYIIQLRSLIQ